MIQADPLLDVAAIKHAVTSSTTCNQDTVKALQLLLNYSQSANSFQNGTSNGRKSSKLIPIEKTRGRPKQKLEVTILEVVDPAPLQLQQGERTRLATEVVNNTLKALTEAIKLPSNCATRPKLQAPDQKSSQRNDGNIEMAKPLQPRSHNRILIPTRDGARSRRSSSLSSSNISPGVTALAECARAAFSALRRTDQLNKGQKTISPFQIETGMSALIGKLIVLGLDDLASKELRILTRRLHMGNATTDTFQLQKKFKRESADEASSSKQTLTDLYYVAQIPENEQHLSLVVASQLHITKLLALRRRKASLDTAYSHLELSTSYSPVNLIERSISTDSLSKDRAARQLESFAQSILSFCPSQAASAGESTKTLSTSVSPEICLRFRLLALCIHWKSWLLVDHQIDIQKQVLDPYHKYIHNFLRMSSSGSQSKYKTLKDAFRFLSDIINSDSLLDSSQKVVYNLSCIEMYKLLADLAYETESLEDAVSWSERSLIMLDTACLSEARKCALLCRAAEIAIRSSLHGNYTESLDAKLHQANSALKGDLHGGSSELDELLVSCASLRKYATLFLIESFQSQETSAGSTHGDQVLFSNTILLSLRFLVRYLGTHPGSDSGKSLVCRYEQRLKLAENVAKSAIEAIVSIIRHPLAEIPEVSKILDDALQQSTHLVTSLEANGPPSLGSEMNTRKASLAVQLSGAFWLRYLRLKSKQIQTSELIRLLQCSIYLIEGRTALEKEQGILPVKLEKLGALYESQSKWSKAAMAYSQALNTLIDSDELCLAAKKAAVSPLSRVFTKDGAIGTFRRILAVYFNVCINDSIKILEPAVGQWSLEKHGFVLETQLIMLVDLASTHTALLTIHSAIEQVSESLLQIYTYAESPLRRLRTTIQILRCHQLIPTIFSRSTIEALGQEAFEPPLTLDEGLATYKDHWQAQRDSLLAIIEKEPRLDLLQAALKRWSCLCCREDRMESMMSNDGIDDIPGLIIHLGSIAEFLNMQGLETQRVATLQLIFSILNSQSSAVPPQYVSNVTELGLQLVRLGHSNQGGISLQKARKHLEDKTLSGTVLLQWYTSYAEYLIEIGNVTKGEEYLGKAKDTFCAVLAAGTAAANRISDRYQQACVAADLMHVISTASLSQGRAAYALYYAKKAVRLSYRAWGLLERRYGSKNFLHDQNLSSDPEDLTDDSSRVQISTATPLPVVSTKHESLKLTLFWPIVPRLFRHLTKLSALLRHAGIFLEAQYYLDQATRIAQAVQAGPLLVKVGSLQGELDISSGQHEHGLSQLKQAKEMIAVNYPTYLRATTYLALAQAYARNGETESENVFLESVESMIHDDSTVEVATQRSSGPEPSDSLIQEIRNLQLGTTAGKRIGTVKPVPVLKRGRAKQVMKSTSDQAHSHLQPQPEHMPFTKNHVSLLTQRGSSYSRQDMFELAADSFNQARTLSPCPSDALLQSLELAYSLLRQAGSGLLGDPVFNVLQDSTISCPAVAFSGCHGSKEMTDATQKNPTKKTRAKAEPKSLGKKQAVRSSNFTELLSTCFDNLNSVHSSAQRLCSSSTLHRLANVLSKTLLLLCAACPASTCVAGGSAMFAAYAMGKSTWTS